MDDPIDLPLPAGPAEVRDDSSQGPTPAFGLHANPPVSFVVLGYF